MTFLPVVERELRTAARRPATYWVRSIAAFGVLALWLLLLIGNRQMPPTRLSQLLFTAFGVLALGFCLFAGIFLTADCLSEEKREGTLGLLFLTDLKGYDVVLGKLLATSLHSVYGLLAIFPVLGLPLMMGGVTAAEFWRVVLVLLVTVLLSLSLGMVVSAFQNETRQSKAGTFLGMLVLTGLFPALWWFLVAISRTQPATVLLLPSPGFAFTAALDAFYGAGSGRRDFWLSVTLLLFLGLFFLTVASFVLPRIWQQKQSPVAKPVRAQPTDWKRSGTGESLLPNVASVTSANLDAPRPVPFRSSLAGESNPFFWLASRVRPGTGSISAAFLLVFALWLCFLLAAVIGGKREAFIVCLFTSYGLHQAFKYGVAVEATRRLSEDKRSGVLELLLVTPLPEAYVISGLKRALEKQFGRAVWLLTSVNLALWAAVLFFSQALHTNTEDQLIFLELFLGGLLMLWLDFKTMCLVGMQQALRANKQHRAVLATFGRVMLPPWTAVFLLVFVGQSLRLNAGGAATLFALWFALGLVTDAILAAQARTDLARGFRACLQESARVVPPAQLPLSPSLRAQNA